MVDSLVWLEFRNDRRAPASRAADRNWWVVRPRAARATRASARWGRVPRRNRAYLRYSCSQNELASFKPCSSQASLKILNTPAISLS